MKRKIKGFIDSHPKEMKVLKRIGIAALLILVYETGFSRGKDYGINNFIEGIIHNYENGGSLEAYTFCSSDPAFGDLMYEITCECIGD